MRRTSFGRLLSHLCVGSLLVGLLALPLFGLEEDSRDGIVLGRNAAFKVAAPVGWVFDDESCRPYPSAVLYPFGKYWGAEPMPVILCDLESKNELVKDDMPLEAANQRPAYRELPGLTTGDGSIARVREPVGGAQGKYRRVASIDTHDAVCELILEAPNQAEFDKAVPVFEEVVRSFRFFGPDSGEYLGSSGAHGILFRTTEIKELVAFSSPDEGWIRELRKHGVTVFKRANGKAYGIIAIYSAQSSLGSAKADYEEGWKECAQSAFAVGSAPVPQSKARERYQVRVGQATVEQDEQQINVRLAVFSGLGKRCNVLTCFNDSSVIPDVESFLKWFYSEYTLSSAAGWSAGSRPSQDYVDGRLVNLTDGYSSRNYNFFENTYEFQGEIKLDADHYVLINEMGSYSVSGNKLTLSGQGGSQRTLDHNGRAVARRSLPAWRRTYNYKLVDVGGAIHGPFLVLGGVKPNDIDGRPGDLFPNSFVYVRGYHPECRFQSF